MKRLKSFALRHFESALIGLILLGVVAIAFLVHYKFAFLNFFFLPVILAGYRLGKRQAVLTASLCILLVTLYQIFSRVVFHELPPISLDDTLSIVIWAGFLILTAAIIGTITEQREARLQSLQRAYVGVLEIMLKYLETADEKKPRSLRLAHLAGRVALALGLPNFEAENIRTAALLLEAGDLRSNISLYEKVASFMAREGRPMEKQIGNRERVLLQTTASLLKEVEPILVNYFYHYVEEANTLDKDLSTIPVGSSIIALTDLYDRLARELPLGPWKEQVRTIHDLNKLSSRSFPAAAVQALFRVISPPD
jgi:hypothetical protein